MRKRNYEKIWNVLKIFLSKYRNQDFKIQCFKTQANINNQILRWKKYIEKLKGSLKKWRNSENGEKKKKSRSKNDIEWENPQKGKEG